MKLENGYEIQTTFWSDFTIADRFGLEAIQDTFDRAFAEWKNDHKYLTELVIVTNWKLWEHYRLASLPVALPDEMPKARLYDELWRQCDAYACDTLKGKELEYFLKWTD